MNIALLECIRYCNDRRECENARFNGGVKAKSSSLLKVFSYVAIAPFKRQKDCIFFDSVGDANSKSGIAYNEILRSTFLKDGLNLKIGLSKSKFSVFIRAVRVLYFILLHSKLLVRVAMRSRFTRAEAKVIFGYIAFKSFLKKSNQVYPLINSDINPPMAVMGAAASAVFGVYWWQDDYHHISAPRIAVRKAAILNRKAHEAMKQRHPSAVIIFRVSKKPRVIKVSSFNSIGVAVNASFCLPKSLEMLKKIKSIFGCQSLVIRLHPTAMPVNSSESWLKFAPKTQTLEEFCDSCDLFVVGNSAVQIKILLAGKPVIHTGYLDDDGFDLYKYVEKGVVYGCLNVDEILTHDFIQHYGSPEHTLLLSDITL